MNPNWEKMGPSSILSVIHTFTIGTVLNLNGGNNGRGLINVRFKQIFKRSVV